MSQPDPSPLPALPERVAADALAAFSDAELDAVVEAARAAERATAAAMAPYTRQMRELASRIAEVGTERKRRERAAHIAARKAVREAAAAGSLPSLADELAADTRATPPSTPLADMRAFLRSGGEIRLGFAGRPGPTAFTDGRQTRMATTWGEARDLYLAGWDAGTAQIPGIRVHLMGSRVERVVDAAEIVLGAPPDGGAEA